MALPTTGLTFHADASVVTDLWKVETGGSFSSHPADGEGTPYWDDVEHADIVAAETSAAPEWRSGTPLMLLPCLDFDGAGDFYTLANNDNTAAKALSALITNSAFTIMVSVYVDAIATNAANPYDNDAIIADNGGFFGIHLKTGNAVFYNWDGNADSIVLPISLATSYVLMFRHEGGNIYASLNGGAESSAASGNTSDVSNTVRIGKNNGSGNKFFNGRMGEIAVWNVALTGSDLTDAHAYFAAKWLEAEVPSEVWSWNTGTSIRRSRFGG